MKARRKCPKMGNNKNKHFLTQSTWPNQVQRKGKEEMALTGASLLSPVFMDFVLEAVT